MSPVLFEKAAISRHLTWLSVAGLVFGVAGGHFSAQIHSVPLLAGLAGIVEIAGLVWVNLLQLVAIPLIVLIIWLALTRSFAAGLGRMGLTCAVLFLAFHLLGGVFIITVSPGVLEQVPLPDASRLDQIRDQISFTGKAPAMMPSGFHAFLRLLFANEYVRFARQYLWMWIVLPILVNLFSHLILKRDVVSPDILKKSLRVIFRMILWLIHLAPLGSAGLVFTMTRSIGLSITVILGHFILGICAVLLLYNLLLLAIARFAGRFKVGSMLRALKYPYLVAITTRSSLAALPVLTEEAGKYLPLSGRIVGFSFPLTASFFKANRVVSSTFQLLFVAHIFQIHLSLPTIVVYVFSIMLVSMVGQGIPGGGGYHEGLPLVVAAGAPAEGYFLLKTVEAIPDIFSTIINTTSFLLVAVFLQRLFSGQAEIGPPGTAPDHLRGGAS